MTSTAISNLGQYRSPNNCPAAQHSLAVSVCISRHAGGLTYISQTAGGLPLVTSVDCDDALARDIVDNSDMPKTHGRIACSKALKLRPRVV